jgi:STE24 endopeptidase
MNVYLTIILVSIIGAYLLDSVVSWLNVRSLDPELPAEFKDVFDPEEYRKSQDYARAGAKLDFVQSTVGVAALTAFILLGGFNAVDQFVRGAGLSPIPTGLLFFGVLFLLSELLNTPFELYDTFVLEERFGFNKMGPKTFVLDKLKGWLLAAVIGGPLLAVVLHFFRAAGDLAWLYAWIVSALVILFIQYLAPTVILPLFNKFTPLEEGELREKLEEYARDQDMDLSGVYVMDGSKRSTKSNAFFTGFGGKKRIALFDTLMERHDNDEILAILAHEVGHNKLGHVKKNLLLAVAKLGLLFLLLQQFIMRPGLFEAFGMAEMSVYAGLAFFVILYSPVSLVLGVAAGFLSRRYEYQADRFAVATTGERRPMIRALKTLSKENLSNLTPHRAKVVLHYSHPPVLKRIKAIRRLSV